MPFGNFVFHGAFKSKKKAVKKERSLVCKRNGKKSCFILRRKVRGGRRYIVLQRKG